MLATTGPSTLVGCQGAPVGGWIYETARAGLRAGHLLLHAADGRIVGELAR